MPREKTTTRAVGTTPRRKDDGNGKNATTNPTTRMTTGPSRDSSIGIADDERRNMIAEAAYLRAERRNFQGGDPTQDWYEAEHEIDAMIANWQRNGRRPRAHA